MINKIENILISIYCRDHPSLLGVRLPPDTEIIKYTSSIVGPKIPGTTTRGRKKTISDQDQTQQQQTKNVLDSKTFNIAFSALSPAKKARLEMEYAAIAAAANAGPGPNLPPTLTAAQIAALSGFGGGSGGGGSGVAGGGGASSTSKSSGVSAASSSQSTPHLDLTGPSSGRTSRDSSSDRVEVIKLPPTITSNGAYNLSNKNKDIHDLSGSTDLNSGVNLSLKPASAASSISNTSLANSNVAGATITIEDFDAPLNLSMKPDKSSASSNDLSGGSGGGSGGSGGNNSGNTGSNSLQSLSSITAALGSSGVGGSGVGGSVGIGVSGVGGGNGGAANSSNTGGNSSSNSSATSVMGVGGGGAGGTNQPPFKEGRPRNLGRGVSKPKKNTVASLLAQSRAVGIKPMLSTQQLLQQGADIVSFL